MLVGYYILLECESTTSVSRLSEGYKQKTSMWTLQIHSDI